MPRSGVSWCTSPCSAACSPSWPRPGQCRELCQPGQSAAGHRTVWAVVVGVCLGGEGFTVLAALGAALMVTGTYWGQHIERTHRTTHIGESPVPGQRRLCCLCSAPSTAPRPRTNSSTTNRKAPPRAVSALRGHPASEAAKCLVLMVKIDRRVTRHVLAVVPGDRRVDLAAIRTLFAAAASGFCDAAAGGATRHAIPVPFCPSAWHSNSSPIRTSSRGRASTSTPPALTVRWPCPGADYASSPSRVSNASPVRARTGGSGPASGGSGGGG